jgi:hypothetical protein
MTAKNSLKKPTIFSKLIIAVHASFVYVYIFCTLLSNWLEYNSLFVRLKD